MPRKGNRRPYTDADLAAIRQLADDGYSRSDIAIITGRSEGSINGTCAYYRIDTHGGRSPHSVNRLDEIARLRRAGVTQSKIARALGLSFDTVHSLCARHGIKKRELIHV